MCAFFRFLHLSRPRGAITGGVDNIRASVPGVPTLREDVRLAGSISRAVVASDDRVPRHGFLLLRREGSRLSSSGADWNDKTSTVNDFAEDFAKFLTMISHYHRCNLTGRGREMLQERHRQDTLVDNASPLLRRLHQGGRGYPSQGEEYCNLFLTERYSSIVGDDGDHTNAFRKAMIRRSFSAETRRERLR